MAGARDRPDVARALAHDLDRLVAAIDHDLRPAFGGKLVQHGRELLSLGRVAALYVDQQPRCGKVASTSVERRHQADALAAKGKGLAAIGRIAMADVELLQIGHGVFARDAVAVGAAIQRPVVKHRELAVGGGMNVELDDIGAGREAGAHRSIVFSRYSWLGGSIRAAVQVSFFSSRSSKRWAMPRCASRTGCRPDGRRDDWCC